MYLETNCLLRFVSKLLVKVGVAASAETVGVGILSLVFQVRSASSSAGGPCAVSYAICQKASGLRGFCRL